MKFEIKSLQGKYAEPSDIMTHAIFQCLVNYVEQNRGYKNCPSFTPEELDYLQDFLYNPEFIRRHFDEYSNEVELWKIYIWWKKTYLPRYRSDDIDDSLETQLDQYRKRVFELRPRLWS